MGCADEETLARFERGALSSEERGLLLDHASECGECRAAISVLVDTAASPGPGPRVPVPERAKIGRYTLGSILGRGAMGVVYAARDPELDRDVAVKLLRPQASALRLRREAQALAKLAHPNVVRVYDVGEDEGQTFIAMELVDGDNLRQWLVTARSIPEVLDVLVRAGRGLAAAHAAGLVHRDFKPDNVLIAHTGEVLVGDFGLARSAELAPPPEAALSTAADSVSSDSLTATGALVGTPAYMAPEQVAGEATPASDQFAFCATAWEALFGRRPFEGATLAELVAAVRAGNLARPEEIDVPRIVEVALRRGLSADPAARFASMEALLAALSPPVRPRRLWMFGTAFVAAAAVATILVTRGAQGPAVDCDATAALLDPVWSSSRSEALAKRYDVLVADAFDGYGKAWRAARVEACRATHERHDQTAETLERRVACLDRARDQLALTLGEIMATTPEQLPHAAEAVSTLPSLGRCDAAQPVAGATTFATAAAVAALDVELTRLEIGFAAARAEISLPEATALRERADAIGYEPQMLRVRLLEARIAGWNGDRRRAEAGLRDVMVRAEQSRDDFARARAGALLALLVADHPDDATAVVAIARAALRRAGADPSIEQLLLEAEVAIALARQNYLAAAEQQKKVIALIEARTTGDSEEVMHAYGTLANIWANAGDTAQWQVANGHVRAFLDRLGERLGAPMFLRRGDPMDFIVRGDLTGAVDQGQQMVAMMRAEKDVPYFTIAQVLDMMTMAHALAGNHGSCLASYREEEEALSLPIERYAFPPNPPDVVAIRKLQISGALWAAGCLRELGRFEEQLARLEQARALAKAGGADTADDLVEAERSIGIVLVALGKMKTARDYLEPAVRSLGRATPVQRAMARFALAQILWSEGGLDERPHAHALVADAIADLSPLLTAPQPPMMRRVPARVAVLLAEVKAWQAAHPLTPASP